MTPKKDMGERAILNDEASCIHVRNLGIFIDDFRGTFDMDNSALLRAESLPLLRAESLPESLTESLSP